MECFFKDSSEKKLLKNIEGETAVLHEPLTPTNSKEREP
jgi:hypothetical protein